MQSGISASSDLLTAFSTFTSDTTLFCLPVTIDTTSLSLTPLPALPFTSTFPHSLQTLLPHLADKTPIYLLLRQDQQPDSLLTAITYVPSTSPVRSKTLFASTRQSLVRELGLEKFEDTLFVTDKEEVVDPREWEGRARAKSGKAGYGDGGAGDTELLSTEERELQSVKRAEEEERHGTGGKQLGGGPGGGQSGGGLAVKATDEAREALKAVGEGELVQLGLEMKNETVELVRKSEVQPEGVRALVPTDKPSYNFYSYPGGEGLLFVYVCPGVSKVKERMMYASSRNAVIEMAKAEGLTVAKRLELDAEDVTAERLAEEAGVGGGAQQGNGPGPAASGRGGFARPKRPGKR